MTQPSQSIQDDAMRDLLHEAADIQVLSSAEVLRRFESIEGRMTSVERGVQENTKLTSGIAEGTAELLDLFKSVKGGFKVMGWLGSFAKWIAGIAAAFAAVYAYVQSLRGH